jgi:putative peptidoglycan lipid II flippase
VRAEQQIPGEGATPAANGAQPRRSASRGALILMGGTLGSRLTGLLRNSLLTQLFSPGVSDAFLTAFKVPNLFRELLAEGALTNSFVPAYARLDRQAGRQLAAAVLGVLLLANGLLLLAAWFAAPWIAGALIGDPALVDVELTTRLIRIVFPFLPAISLSALAMVLLNASEKFLAPAWAPVALNVVTVTLMALFPGQAVPLALAHVLGGVAQLLVQLPALVRFGLLPARIRLWHPALGGVLLLMVPFAVTSSGRQVLNLVASNVITSIDAGAQTAFHNADLFLSLALGLFSISPALSYYSRLSGLAVHEPEAFRPTLLAGLRLISFLTIPAGVALLLFAGQAVEVVFNWRSLLGVPLTDGRLELSRVAVAPLGLAVFPIGLSNLLIRTFYIRRQVLQRVLVTLATLLLQGALYVLLARTHGLAGVAWATVAASTLQLLVLAVLVARRERFGLRQLLRSVLLLWLAALLAGGLLFWLLGFIAPSAGWFTQLAVLLLGGALFGLTYLVLCVLLKIPGVHVPGLDRLLRRPG